MSEEVNSPPFPKSMITVEGLHTCIVDLINWVNSQKDWVNTEADRLNAPDDQFRITHTLVQPTEFYFVHNFQKLPVVYLYSTFVALREIRVTYDDLVRNYENLSDWQSDVCIVRRMALVKAASDLASFVCLDKEKQEAFLQAKHKSGFKRFKQMLKDVASAAWDEDDDNDEELDDLFNKQD